MSSSGQDHSILLYGRATAGGIGTGTTPTNVTRLFGAGFAIAIFLIVTKGTGPAATRIHTSADAVRGAIFLTVSPHDTIVTVYLYVYPAVTTCVTVSFL